MKTFDFMDMELMQFIIYVGSLAVNIGLGGYFLIHCSSRLLFRYEHEQNLKND